MRLRQLPLRRRLLIGLGVFIAAVGLGELMWNTWPEVSYASVVLGIAAWIYIAKGGEFGKDKSPYDMRIDDGF